MIFIKIPGLKTENTANICEHWTKRAKRAKAHRTASYYALLATGKSPPVLPLKITLVSFRKRKLDHSDGLNISFKNIRDGIADFLKVNDSTEKIEWIYRQEISKEYSVTILIESVLSSLESRICGFQAFLCYAEDRPPCASGPCPKVLL